MLSNDMEAATRAQVAHLMRVAMVANATHHHRENPYQSIDPFSAVIFENHGLLTTTDCIQQPNDMLAILASPDAPSRIPALAGPYVFVRHEDQASVFDPADMLADPVASNRLAGLRYFLELPDGVLGRQSRQQIDDAKLRIASDDRTEWFAAAKGVYNLLQDDVYLTLAGFAQCYAIGYIQGVNEFLPKLLRPDAAILSSIELECWNPSEDYESAEALVSRLTSSLSLNEALVDYYRQLGHLPLCGALGVGRVLREWAKAHPGVTCWDTVWGWAEESQSPVARYHACAAFLSNPDLVPTGTEEFLWREVGDVINAYPEGSARARWVEAWAVRDDLALHFGNYLNSSPSKGK